MGTLLHSSGNQESAEGGAKLCLQILGPITLARWTSHTIRGRAKQLGHPLGKHVPSSLGICRLLDHITLAPDRLGFTQVKEGALLILVDPIMAPE